MSTNRVEVELIADISSLQSSMKQATQIWRNFQQAVNQPINIPTPHIPTPPPIPRPAPPPPPDMSAWHSTFQGVGNSVRQAGQTMQNAFAPAAAASGLALGKMINDSREFETQTRRAAILTNGSYNQVKADILEMAKTSVYSTGQVAAAYAEMGAKGFDAAKATAALPGVLSAAAASGEDLGLVADTITSALNAFGLEASQSGKVADVLAQSANQSAASVLDLNYAFKYSAGPAHALGISMEELAASIGIMVDAGSTGESAGTALRASMLRLVKPPKEAANALEKLGVTTTDSNGKMKPLAQLMGELQKGMEGYTDAQKASTMASIFGTESVSAMLNLMNAGPEKITKMTKALENSGGASKKAADEMLEGWAGAMSKMESALDVAGRAFTDALAPAITAVSEKVAGLANWFSDLPSSVQTTIATIAAVATAFLIIGTVVGIAMSAIGTLISGIGGLGVILFGTAGEVGLLSTAFAALTGPIGIAVAAIIGLVAGIMYLWNTNEGFKNAIITGWQAIQNAAATVWNFILNGILLPVWNAIISLGQQLFDQLSSFWQQNGENIMQIAQTVWGFVQTYVVSQISTMVTIATTLFNVLSSVVKSVWGAIKSIISGALDVILGIIGVFVNVLTGDWRGAWDSVKQIASGAWSMISNAMRIGADIVLGVIKGLGDSIGGTFGDMANKFYTYGKNIIQGLIDGLKSMAGSVKSVVGGIASDIKEKITSALKIHSPSRWMRDMIGVNMMQGWINGIDGMRSAVLRTSQNIAEWMKPEMLAVDSGYGDVSVAKSVAPSVYEARESSSRKSVQQPTRPMVIKNVLVMDGREVARVTQPYIDEIQADNIAIKSYMRGVQY